jgi:hypothetical protein
MYMAVFNLSPFGKIIANLMYSDLLTVSRRTKGKDKYGRTVDSTIEDIYTDIPCKCSFSQKDEPSDTQLNYMPVKVQITLFVSNQYKISPGNEIVVKRTLNGVIQEIVKGRAGKPNTFDTHQEIPVEIEGTN